MAFGTIPESSTFRFLERENGKTYLSAKVVIWKNYFPIIMDILKRRNGNVKVSIELAVIKGDQNETTGVLDIEEFRLLSCVLLGEGIMEGIEGSHLEVLKFSMNEEDIKKANECYLKFSLNNNKYEIPEMKNGEYCMKTAQEIGLDVASVEIRKINDLKFLLVKRFDREIKERVHSILSPIFIINLIFIYY